MDVAASTSLTELAGSRAAKPGVDRTAPCAAVSWRPVFAAAIVLLGDLSSGFARSCCCVWMVGQWSAAATPEESETFYWKS